MVYQIPLVAILYKRIIAISINLHDFQDLVLYAVILWLPISLIIAAIMPQEELLLLMAQGQHEQNNTNTTTTDMTNLRDTIIPQAQEVNEANSELIKICVSAPNPECDNTMVIIRNDCVAYPEFVATHIPSCDDSRLISYLLARGLLE
jgi:hypothetical protein